MVDERVAEVGERQPAQPRDRLVRLEPALGHVLEQCSQRRFVHHYMLPETAPNRPGRDRRHHVS